MKKINIIQFLPYFPPHKGGLETVGEEIGKYWIKKNMGYFINVVSEFEQEKETSPQSSTLKGHQGPLEERKQKQIIFMGEVIGYKKDGYEVLVCPSIEIINNFPIYKFWDKKYGIIMQYLKEKIGKEKENFRVLTHTRFFLTSFIGGSFARKNKIKWIHIEHGSSYVKLSSKLKSFLSIIYDKSFGKWIFKKANKILAISEACKSFINNEFVDKEVKVFYRGIELKEKKIEKKGNLKLCFIGRLVKLKGIDNLLKAYKKLNFNIELNIIGSGEEELNLKKYVEENNLNNITFLGFKNKFFIEEDLSENKIILINPSYQEGLPTTVLEGLFFKNVVIASNAGGTTEISDKEDLILFKAGNIEELKDNILYAINNYDNLVGKSYEIVKNKFDWENNILKLYNLIK